MRALPSARRSTTAAAVLVAARFDAEYEAHGGGVRPCLRAAVRPIDWPPSRGRNTRTHALQSHEIRIGTRGSPLALAQAEETRFALAKRLAIAPEAIQIVRDEDDRDKITDRPISEAGGKGLFTKEIDEALLDGRIDVGVHSAKDMATRLPDGIVIAACLPRQDVRDAFVSPVAARLADLPEGAVVGTSSLRRRALALRLRPDLRVVDLRGNVDTRLRKIAQGEAQGDTACRGRFDAARPARSRGEFHGGRAVACRRRGRAPSPSRRAKTTWSRASGWRRLTTARRRSRSPRNARISQCSMDRAGPRSAGSRRSTARG